MGSGNCTRYDVAESKNHRSHLEEGDDRRRSDGTLEYLLQLEWLPPKEYHRVCVRHLQSNFNDKVKDSTLKEKLGRVTYQSKKHKFEAGICRVDGTLGRQTRGRRWLDIIINKELWSLAFDNCGIRWASMTTSASESSHGWV
ncbi:hypothetical protein QQ045_014482 [Rhodiola kirilowii]